MQRHRGVITGASLVALAALVAGATALATAEVVAEGKLVPSGGTGVRRIRVWSTVEFYISSETARPSTDLLTALALAIATAVLGFSALVLFSAGHRDRLVGCFALGAVGMGYLTADELLAIHESLGHNLQFLRRWTGVERPDDLVFASYSVPGCLFLWYFRTQLLSVQLSRVLFAAGAACVLLAMVFDLAHVAAEEYLELLGAAALVAGLIWLTVTHVGSRMNSVRDAVGDDGTEMRSGLRGDARVGGRC